MHRVFGCGAAACKGVLHLPGSYVTGPAARLRVGLTPSAAPFRYLQIRMVEGHQCHRVGHAHRRLLMGHRFKAHSPNKRFSEGAAAISGQVLSRIEVHGKQLFYFFGDAQAPVVMQIHFGMSGAFKTMAVANPREERDTTRLVLQNTEEGLLAHLSAMTVQHGDLDFYHKMSAKLGPDPLREDADGELLWAKMQASKKPVGLILMDQAAVAGVGNIYRAEILFKAGVHPEQPCNTVDRAAFERIWHHTVTLLQRGFQTGSILTVDPEDAKRLGRPWTRRYVYNHPACGKCGSKISCWDMANRTVYACETCQPLTAGTVLPSARSMALAAAHPTKEFISHCAPEETIAPAQMTVIELKHKLSGLGISIAKSAKKGAMVAQLEAALAERSPAAAAPAASHEAGASQELASPGPSQVSWIEAEAQAGADRDVAAGQQVAPEGPEQAEGMLVVKQEQEHPIEDLSKLTVAELKARLKAHKQPVKGRKAELLDRLSQALQPAAEAEAPEAEAEAVAHVASTANGSRQGSGEVAEASVTASGQGAAKAAAISAAEQAASRGTEEATGPAPAAPKPGTQQLDNVATAQDAALEKERAGEGRNVEHVALMDDAVPEASKSKGGKPRRAPKRKAAAAENLDQSARAPAASASEAAEGAKTTKMQRKPKHRR